MKNPYSEDLNMSEALYLFVFSQIEETNQIIGSSIPDSFTRSGPDSLDVATGDCVITALENWGDYSYSFIESVAIDSCGYSPSNGIHVDNIPHLLDILYPGHYIIPEGFPSSLYYPDNMVAVIKYRTSSYDSYHLHMVNVLSCLRDGFITFYNNGQFDSATWNHCLTFYKKTN
ncbi:MAG: hypothetical protein IJ654_06025 [Bacteroidales bacterium]|nr:hypothetical protein [Bacteroidales bacterium]